MRRISLNSAFSEGGSEGHSHGSGWSGSVGQELQESYMRQVSKFPPLSPEEESALTKEYGDAKQKLFGLLRRYPSIFIEIMKGIRTDESYGRITNYFVLEDTDSDDENNVRQMMVHVSSNLLNMIPGVVPSWRYNEVLKPNEFWNMLEPLKPRHYLFKKACILLEDEQWRKQVMTPKDWRAIQETIATSREIMTRVSNKLVEHNLRLVISIAGRYMNCGIQLQDLVQEGNIGLMNSIERFDYTLGHRFSTYASYWIRQAITRNITNHSRIIRMPANTVALVSQIRLEERHILNETGEEATPEMLAERVGISPAKVRALQEMMQQPISLHSIISEDKVLEDTIADQEASKPSDSSDLENLKEAVAKLLDVLTERERKIVCMHFGINGEEPQTLTTIGRELGLSRERIRQLELRALHKLRLPSALKIVEGYSKF